MTRAARKAAWIASGVALALAAVAVAAWLGRDLPRREVERALASRLGARVSVGAVEALGLRDFVLRDLTVREYVAEPRLESVAVKNLRARGGIREILEGRFESLTLRGVVARVVPSPATPPAAPVGEPLEVAVGRLEVEEAVVVLAGPSGESRLECSASLEGIGTGAAGTVRGRSSALQLLPVLEVAGVGRSALPFERGALEGLELSAAISEAGRRIDIEAGAKALSLRRSGRDLAFPAPRTRAALRLPGGDGPIRVEAELLLDVWEAASGTLEIALPSRAIEAASARVRGIDLGRVAEIAGVLPDGSTLEGRADLEVSEAGPDRADYRASARLDRVALRLGGGSLAADGTLVRASGRARPDRAATGASVEAILEVPRLSGSVAGCALPDSLAPLRLSASGDVDLAGTPRFEGRLALSTASAGAVDASGRVSSSGADLRWTWSGGDLSRLLALAGSAGFAVPGSVAVSGSAEASGTLSGPLTAPALDGTLRLAALEARSGSPTGWSFAKAGVDARLAWPAPGRPVEVPSLEAAGEITVPPLTPFPVSLRAALRIEPSVLALGIERARIEAPGLASVAVKGSAGARGPRRADLEIAVDDVDLARWQSFLRPRIGDPVPGFSVTGTASSSADVTLLDGGRVQGSGTVRVAKSGFASEDGAHVLEGLDTAWAFTVAGSTGDPSLSFHAESPVGGFQLLWGSLFLDGSGLKSRLEASGEVALPRRGAGAASPWRVRGLASWTFPGGPRVEGSIAAASGGPLEGSVALEADDLAETVRRYVRAPLGDSIPFFKRVEAAGSLAAEMRATSDAGTVALEGVVRAKNLGLAGTEGYAEVEGLDLDLPIAITFGPGGVTGARPVSGDERSGRLRFARAAVGGLAIGETATRLRVRADSLSLEKPLSVPLLGGTLAFDSLTLADLARPSRHVETAIEIRDLDVGEASRALGLPPLEGTVDGYLPEVRVSPDSLLVTGGGEVRLFGGVLAFGDISGQDVLSRYPKFSFSASFRDIDLGALTRKFDFGEMGGTLEGWVRDCELFRGVPVRFEAEARTRAREGVRRAINVKAINNIAILGTGGRVSVFDRGIHKFLDTYTYEALGIRASLQNDIFVLRGLERRKEKELFLKGRLPFPIDVVNVAPGQSVSFRAMLERLRSLDVSTATTRKR